MGKFYQNQLRDKVHLTSQTLKHRSGNCFCNRSSYGCLHFNSQFIKFTIPEKARIAILIHNVYEQEYKIYRIYSMHNFCGCVCESFDQKKT